MPKVVPALWNTCRARGIIHLERPGASPLFLEGFGREILLLLNEQVSQHDFRMDSITESESGKITASHVQEPDKKGADSSAIVPLKREAVEDAQHIKLSWRSWVRARLPRWAALLT